MPSGPAARDPFPETRWSRVVAAGDPAHPETRRALDALARDYWQPIRIWLQGRCGLAADAAADLAQDFFVQLLERQTIGRADPLRGSFRAFLKASLRNFTVDRHRGARAQKRGGGATVRSFADAHTPEPEDAAAGPDRALDEAWQQTLLQRALAALEGELRAADKTVCWAVFADYFLAATPDVDYAAVAAQHAITTTAVGNHLMHAKRRFREHLRAAVAETVDGARALADELAWLFAGVKP